MQHIIMVILISLTLSSAHAQQSNSQLSLYGQHNGCDSPSNARSPDCVAAMHRYCAKSGHGGAGMSQELALSSIGVACVNPNWYGDVQLSELRRLHNGCDDIRKSQTSDCMAAVHRWCNQSGKGGGGIVQEVGDSVLGVACINAKYYGDAPLHQLTNEHSGCSHPNASQDSDCVAAVHRWCIRHGHGDAGISQEVGDGVFGVACFNVSWYGNVRVLPAYSGHVGYAGPDESRTPGGSGGPGGSGSSTSSSSQCARGERLYDVCQTCQASVGATPVHFHSRICAKSWQAVKQMMTGSCRLSQRSASQCR